MRSSYETSLKFFTLFFLISIICVPVLAQEPLSETQFLPGDGVLGPAAGDQANPVIFRGDDQSLVVWVDSRTDMLADLLTTEGGDDIYAARLDAAGNLVDTTPIIISQDAGEQTRAHISWNGENWLVVWVSQVPTEFFYTDQIFAARISSAGALLDAVPIPIVTFASSSNGELYDVASDGSNWAVAWKDFVGSQWKIRGVRISNQGVVLDAVPITLHTTSSQPYQGTFTFAQDEYLLAWKEWRYPSNDDILARRFTTSLQQMETNAFLVTSHADYDTWPDISTNGTDFLVVWERYNTCCVGGGGKVYGSRISHSGTVMDPVSIAISGNVGETIGRSPHVSWDGTNYFIGWVVGNDLFAARVTPGGGVLDFGGVPVGTGSSLKLDPDIAGKGAGGAQMVWQSNRAGGILPYDIYSAAISDGGVPSTEVPISFGAPTQLEGDVQTSGSGYMIAYRSEHSGIRRIVAQPLDLNGDPITTEPVELASGPYLSNPALAWNGSLYFVAWASTDVSLIYGKRINADGVVLDSSPIQIMPGITPDVAALGDTFLVVGTHTPINVEFRHPFSKRVRGSDGVVMDATPRQLGQYFAQNPSVCSIGGRWLATWQRNNSHDDPDANINAAFINPDGTASSEFIVAGTFFWELYTPAVSSNGENALIVWRDSRNGFSNIDIYGRRISAAGTLLAELPIATAIDDQFRPEVAWNGSEYVVAYQDQRNVPFFFDERSDIYASRVTSDGVLLDPDGFAVANTSLPEIHPAVAGSNGIALLLGSLFESSLTSYRIGYSFLGLPVSGIPCSAITSMAARCIGGAAKTVQVRVNLMNSTIYAGDSVTVTIDGTPFTSTIISNGTHSRANFSVPGWSVGTHTVALVDPASCVADVHPSCALGDGIAKADPEWDDDAEWTVPAQDIPQATKLLGNYPNPFNPSTSIQYALVEETHVILKIYNMLGQEVATLVDEVQAAGYKSAIWSGKNDSGSSVASGLYIYTLKAGNVVKSERMLLMK